jgi:hypothetical protein
MPVRLAIRRMMAHLLCSESPLEGTSVCEVLFYYAWTPIPLPDNYKGRFPLESSQRQKMNLLFQSTEGN